MDKLMSICTHVGSDSSCTISIAANPMLTPDDVFIPVAMITALPLQHICPCCGEPYVCKR